MSIGGEFNVGPFNQGPPGSGTNAVAVSDDAGYLAGLISTAALEYDVNSAGGTPGAHAGYRPQYEPVAGFEAIPCRIVWKRAAAAEGDSRPGQAQYGRVLLGWGVRADRRYRLVYADPSWGRTHLYLMGRVRDAHQMAHHWVVDVQDRPI